MPIHLDELNVVHELDGSGSALIVACNMCAGASCAQRENRPFIEFFKSRLKSPPLERYIARLSVQLGENGVKAEKFKAGVIQQFFLCLWSLKQRRRFRECAKEHSAVIVLGCDSAIKTVQDALYGTGCHVIKGMEVAGVTNTKTRVSWPGRIYFEDSSTARMCDLHCKQSSPTARGQQKPTPVLQAGCKETPLPHAGVL
jgi:hypothetical protein